jgi:hypothetical protein
VSGGAKAPACPVCYRSRAEAEGVATLDTLPPGHPAPSPGGIRAYCTTCLLRVGQQYENAALLVWRTARGPAGPSKAVRPIGTLRTEGWQRLRAGCSIERLYIRNRRCKIEWPAVPALCKTLILRDARRFAVPPIFSLTPVALRPRLRGGALSRGGQSALPQPFGLRTGEILQPLRITPPPAAAQDFAPGKIASA